MHQAQWHGTTVLLEPCTSRSRVWLWRGHRGLKTPGRFLSRPSTSGQAQCRVCTLPSYPTLKSLSNFAVDCVEYHTVYRGRISYDLCGSSCCALSCRAERLSTHTPGSVLLCSCNLKPGQAICCKNYILTAGIIARTGPLPWGIKGSSDRGRQTAIDFLERFCIGSAWYLPSQLDSQALDGCKTSGGSERY